MTTQETNTTIELPEARAMVSLPENAVEVEIISTVYNNGELIKVSKNLKLSEIQSAFMDAENNYTSDDDRWVITEKGIEWLEGISKNDRCSFL